MARKGLAGGLLAALLLAGCATVPAGDMPAATAGPVTLQILALNDFHGNLEVPDAEVSYATSEGSERRVLGGAARLGATLARLRQGQQDTITVAAGDLIGASPFISANYLDEPTVTALGMAGLAVASVGNHEFDRGIAELRRMQEGGCDQHTTRIPCAVEPFAGASFAYLAGNVVDGAGQGVFPGTAIRQIGPARIGFIGLTLRDTATLVSPSATQGYAFLDEAETANRLARQLLADGADTVVLLVHEGGRVDPTQNLSGCPGLSGPIVPIVERLDPAIRLVVSGHTHQSYVCQFTLPDGSARLLSSAGRYGAFVTDIRLTYDAASDRVTGIAAVNVPVSGVFGEQGDIRDLVTRYAEAAAPVAAREVGRIDPGPGEGGNCPDSQAADLVADAQLAAARQAVGDHVDAAFINTGGVRTGLAGARDGVMTYGEIFAMQPFGNTLQVLEMTGADIAAALEEQFCGTAVAAPCFSLLVPSANMAYRYDRSRPAGQRITAIMLDGHPLDLGMTYQVAFNNFLANGGDGFASLARLQTVGEAGTDLDALESYLAGNTVAVPACGRLVEQTPAA